DLPLLPRALAVAVPRSSLQSVSAQFSPLPLHDALPISKLGDGVDRLHVPLVGRLRRDKDQGRVWGAIVDGVLRRPLLRRGLGPRSEEHTSELRHEWISYAVFCLK